VAASRNCAEAPTAFGRPPAQPGPCRFSDQSPSALAIHWATVPSETVTRPFRRNGELIALGEVGVGDAQVVGCADQRARIVKSAYVPFAAKRVSAVPG
jgi:hypothetical protein